MLSPRLTIYDDVELGRLNAITTVWDLSYKVRYHADI